MDLTKILEHNFPVIGGAVVEAVAQRLAQNALVRVPVMANNKEILSIIFILVGAYGRGLGGDKAFWDGVLVMASVNLIANLLLRFGIDVI